MTDESKPRFTLEQMRASLRVVMGAAAEAPLPVREHEAVGKHGGGLDAGLEDWNRRLEEFEQGVVKLELVKDGVQH